MKSHNQSNILIFNQPQRAIRNKKEVNTKPARKERIIERPPEVTIPEQALPDPIITETTAYPRITPPRMTVEDSLEDLTGLTELPDGNYIPLVRVKPVYPRSAQERGIEGYVTLSFSIDADGTVIQDSIQIVDAKPKGVFNKAATRAAAKFRYKPQVSNGRAQQVTGVQYKFTFGLTNEGQ